MPPSVKICGLWLLFVFVLGARIKSSLLSSRLSISPVGRGLGWWGDWWDDAFTTSLLVRCNAFLFLHGIVSLVELSSKMPAVFTTFITGSYCATLGSFPQRLLQLLMFPLLWPPLPPRTKLPLPLIQFACPQSPFHRNHYCDAAFLQHNDPDQSIH